MSILSYSFMHMAIVAAIVTGLTAPAIGTFIVQRRLALLGDGLGHIALTGVALGFITGWSPLGAAILVAIAGAIAIELLRTYAKASSDVALAMLFYGGIAGGVFLTNLSGNSAATLNRYLFGSITTMSRSDVILVVALGSVVLITCIALAPQFFALSHDEEHARASGVPTRVYGMLIAVLAAVTIAVSMRTVGLLLVSALMVMPVAAAQQLRPSFRGTHFLAMGFGLFSATAGLLLSASIDAQPGPTIVLLALVVFAAAALARGLVSIRKSKGEAHG